MKPDNKTFSLYIGNEKVADVKEVTTKVEKESDLVIPCKKIDFEKSVSGTGMVKVTFTKN